MITDDFLDRVFGQMADFTRKPGFSSAAWTYAKRPTKEGLGRYPLSVDVDAMATCILNVEEYPRNVRFVSSVEIVERRSPTDFTYVQKMSLPVLGGVQVALVLQDRGERDGYRVVSWSQDNDLTGALDKKQGGARTAYNLGAWIMKPTEVWFALSTAPVKQDVGSLKFAVMTRGAEVTAGEVIKSNIEGMVDWSKRA